MSFIVITDSACNLRHDFLQEHNVPVIPYSYFVNGEEHHCLGPEEFDGDSYYKMLSEGGEVKTTLINSQVYDDYFRPHLEAGSDLLYVGMSSGISSSMNMATLAARDLMDEFPERKVVIFDARTASLGEAIFVLAAIRRRDKGLSLADTTAQLIALRPRVCSYLTVGDLMFLSRGGRVSGVAAIIGTMLGVKPLLHEEGAKIVAYGKTRGRKKALRAIADECINRMEDDPDQCVSIAHGGCEEEAVAVADMIREAKPGTEIELEIYEPVTGSYVGPGTVALFFVGRKE
jgi:DegV family protein with EDD domain